MNIYIKFDNQESGPFDLKNLKNEISNGNIPKDALWSSNQLMWLSLDRLPGLFVSKIIVNSPEKKERTNNSKLGPPIIRKNQNNEKNDETIEIIKKIFGVVVGVIGVIIFVVIKLSNIQVTDSGNANGAKNNNDKQARINNNQEIKTEVKEKEDKNNMNNNQMRVDNVKNDQNDGGQKENKTVSKFGNNQDKQDFIPRERFHPEEIFEMCAPSVAQVVCGKSTGSGFLVAKGILVTNDHVVSKSDKGDEVALKFHSAQGKESEARTGVIIKKIPQRDLAFIRVNTGLQPLILARLDQIKPGRMVVAIGSPGIGEGEVAPNTISQGVIGQFVNVDLAPLQLSIALNPGNSGGPAIDSSGKVVGAVTLKRNQEGIAYCVPSDQIYEELLKFYKD